MGERSGLAGQRGAGEMRGGDGRSVTIGPRLRRLLGQPLHGILGTSRVSGTIQMNPIWFDVAGTLIRLNTTRGRAWLANIERDGRATLFVIDPLDAYRWAQLEAELETVTPSGGHRHVQRLARRYTGRPYAYPRGIEERLVVRLRVRRIVGRDGGSPWEGATRR
jgi:PPOX class probable F420-dependent enzyme